MKKNIVFLMADQLAAGFIGCYGSGVPSTPVLDRLAEEGVRYDQCYTTCPVCAPNRATFLTGRSPSMHGVVYNNMALPRDLPTYATVLREHGYRTGGFGKFHQTPMQMPVPDNLDFLGFDECAVSEDPKWGPWLEWVRTQHPEHYETALAMCWEPAKRPLTEAEYAAWSEARMKILHPLRTASEWTQMYASPLPKEVHDTTYITEVGIDFMQRHLDAHADQPFFCHMSFVDPHDPYDPPAPYSTMFRPEDMPDPLPNEWIQEDIKSLDSNRSYINFRDICDNVEAIRKFRAYYHGSLKFLDDQIGKIVAFLKERGIWDNTILVFTTDHGDMMGDHGLIAKGSPHYDKSIRCPLIMSGGGITPHVSDRLTCTLDFYPTFCEWAGVPKQHLPPLEGISFAVDAAGESTKLDRREVYVSFGNVHTVVTDDGWRLTRFVGEEKGQMFNLREDPLESQNLYNHPDYQAQRVRLLEQLVSAASRPHAVGQFRNLPIINEVRHYPDHIIKSTPGLPLYRPNKPSAYH